MHKIYPFVFTVLQGTIALSQIQIKGRVYKDAALKQPVDSALVYTSSGTRAYTGKTGFYTISIPLNTDSLHVFYENKILFVRLPQAIGGYTDIYLTDTSRGRVAYNQLKPVFVKKSTYKQDSIRNREDYEDIFNYRKRGVRMGNNKWRDSINGLALDTKDKKLSGMDVSDALIGFSRTHRQKMRLQKRLVTTEQVDYVHQYFTPALVEQYTAMHDDDSLRHFIQLYTPAYTDFINMNDLDLGMYILTKVREFRMRKPEANK